MNKLDAFCQGVLLESTIAICLILNSTTLNAQMHDTSILDFSDARQVSLFRSIDDQVMGGISQSNFSATGKGTAVFQGNVSSENNGGFASVRANLGCLDLSSSRGLSIRFRADGKRYKIRLFHTSQFDTLAYELAFTTPNNEWRELHFDFADFEAKWRGRKIQDAKPLNTTSICGLGFLISDNQIGAFRLELDWVHPLS